MKVLKKTITIWAVFVSLVVGIAIIPSAAENLPEEKPRETLSRLTDTILDVSALYGTWECLYHSEGGYVQDGMLRISICEPTEMQFESRFHDETVTVTHNLNEIWGELSDLLEIDFASGDFPILVVALEETPTYEIEIPTNGFLTDQYAVIRISEKGLSYQDPDMRETSLSRVAEPEESEIFPAESKASPCENDEPSEQDMTVQN